MAEPAQIAYRTLKGVGILDTAPIFQPLSNFTRPEGNIRCTSYSPDGRFFAWASPEQVSVIDPSVGSIITHLPAANVYDLGFSPLGNYIITWQRPTKDENGDADKNLKVWKTVDAHASQDVERIVVGQFVQKSQTGWNLQYTSDERFCARLVTNEIQFYESSDLSTVWNKLRVEGVSDFAVSRGKDHSVAVFVPERKGAPAAIKVFNVPKFDRAVSQKTFYKADKVQLKWNATGTSIIVLASTDVDKSNRSYYGESNMFILNANGGFDSRIQLDKEGPIHDVTWSPSAKEFGVVYGYMPAKTTIFNERADPQHNFNLGPRNTILFSPHGRFVVVAGFGNLAGQLDIYDLEKEYEKIATIEASNASVCEFSPDGAHILTATTSPRLRVDNGVRLWHVGGGLMYNEEMNELYDVQWRPQSIDKHPIGDPLDPTPTPHASALEYLGKAKTPSKPAGAYRPPGARGTSTPLHFKREDQGGAAYVSDGMGSSGSGVNGFGPRGRRAVPGVEAAESLGRPLPPGAAPGGGVSLTLPEGEEGMSKAALKNKKKREAKKAREAAEKGDKGGDGGGGGLLDPKSSTMKGERSRSHNRSRSRNRGERGENGKKEGSNPERSSNRNRSMNRGPGAEVSPSPAPGRKTKGQSKQGDQTIQAGKIQARAAKSVQNAQEQANGSPAPTHKPNKLPPIDPNFKPPQPPPIPEIAETLASPMTPITPGSASPHEKKVRALLKKLRAIEELKMRQAGGEPLELSQVSKIQSEDKVKQELESMHRSAVS